MSLSEASMATGYMPVYFRGCPVRDAIVVSPNFTRLGGGVVFGGQVEHTRDVMSEVEAVSQQYEGLAVSCSQLYFALETLREVHFLYHFSLRFFQDILAQVRHRDTVHIIGILISSLIPLKYQS